MATLILRMVRREAEERPVLRWMTEGEFAYYQRTGLLADWARPRPAAPRR